jgi:hypothetical protein
MKTVFATLLNGNQKNSSLFPPHKSTIVAHLHKEKGKKQGKEWAIKNQNQNHNQKEDPDTGFGSNLSLGCFKRSFLPRRVYRRREGCPQCEYFFPLLFPHFSFLLP